MRERRFQRLRTMLADRGVSARYAERLVAELNDHYHDIEAERLVAGESPARAAREARRALGAEAAIGALVLARPELHGCGCGLRAAWRVVLAHAGRGEPGLAMAGPALARWGASIAFGTLLTVAWLLGMAHALTLGA